MSKKTSIAITLGIMCVILVFGIFVQLNTIANAVSTVGQTSRENKLRDEVLVAKEQYDRTYSHLEQLEKQLETARKESTNRDENAEKNEAELKKINTYYHKR